MDFRIIFLYASGSQSTITDIISLNFTKERYTPYTKLSGKVWFESAPEEIKGIVLSGPDGALHVGIADSVSYQRSEGKTIVSFSSRGYTCALAHNQLTPGLYPNVTLRGILSNDISLPYVTYENMSDTTDYIFVKENDTMWDAAAAFARKLGGDYPYISGSNNVRVTRDSGTSLLSVSSEKVISEEVGQNYTRVVSHLHMKDLEGSYNTYNLTNQQAVDRQLVRHRHISFDRQWLSNPDEALRSAIDYSMRGIRYKKVRIEGYLKAELRQYASVSCQSFDITRREISRIDLSLSEKGIFTTLWFYDDSYTQ